MKGVLQAYTTAYLEIFLRYPTKHKALLQYRPNKMPPSKKVLQHKYCSCYRNIHYELFLVAITYNILTRKIMIYTHLSYCEEWW